MRSRAWYRELTETILSAPYLEERLDALHAIVESGISRTDRGRLESANSSLRTFIARRTAFVEAELDSL